MLIPILRLKHLTVDHEFQEWQVCTHHVFRRAQMQCTGVWDVGRSLVSRGKLEKVVYSVQHQCSGRCESNYPRTALCTFPHCLRRRNHISFPTKFYGSHRAPLSNAPALLRRGWRCNKHSYPLRGLTASLASAGPAAGTSGTSALAAPIPSFLRSSASILAKMSLFSLR